MSSLIKEMIDEHHEAIQLLKDVHAWLHDIPSHEYFGDEVELSIDDCNEWERRIRKFLQEINEI